MGEIMVQVSARRNHESSSSISYTLDTLRSDTERLLSAWTQSNRCNKPSPAMKNADGESSTSKKKSKPVGTTTTTTTQSTRIMRRPSLMRKSTKARTRVATKASISSSRSKSKSVARLIQSARSIRRPSSLRKGTKVATPAVDEESLSSRKKSKPVATATTTQVKESGGESAAKNKMSTSGKEDTKSKADDKKSRRLNLSEGKNSDAAGATRNLRREASNSA